MTSTPPPPPKSGGSGPFIAAALVMLLLMGGLIYWKTRGTAAPPPAAPPPTTVATTHVFDEPPPPPPPPEEPKDAGVDAKLPAKRVVSSGSAGCAGECKGEEPANLRSILTGKAAQARGCYERALRQNNMLAGRLKVGLRIGPTGNVCSAKVTLNELGDPGVASCVLTMFRTSPFPAPTGGCVDAEVPMKFEPRK